jgi:Zn-dependent protease with chaperone function
MNFFDRQRKVQRLSWWMVLLFIVAVLGIIATVDLIVLFFFGGGRSTEEIVAMLVVTSIVVAGVIGLSSLFRMMSLRSGGGGHVARSLGAVPVPQDTSDPQLRRFRNVVEEVAIASGAPVPELYVMEGEAGINAFAAGWSPSDAAVAVTRGALERLNRDELQGVIAHEFSHVVNGDMRLNIRLMGLVFGILVLALIGRTLLYVRGGQRNPLPLIGLALLVVGFAGIFIGRIIKAAVSRQREYLADASAVQFTRQTDGLTGALKKIGGLPTGSNLRNAKAEDVSHMLFGSGRGFAGMFATHPPLVKRIQALDPTFNPGELDQLARRWSADPPSGLAEDRAMGLTGGRGSLPAADTSVTAAPAEVAAHVGAPPSDAYQHAGTILAQIPEDLRDRAHRDDTVVPLVFGLLLSSQHEVRVNQHAVLVQRHGQEVADAAWREAEQLASLHPMLRLPLAEVAFPALRHRSAGDQQTIMGSVNALIQADGRLSVSEYCLSRLLHEELYEAANRRPPWGRKRYSLSASRAASATLLATLAQAGHDNAAEAEAAFHAGTARLFSGQPPAYQPPTEGVLALESVWPRLDGLNPADKQLLVEAMVTVISHAGEIRVAELELLRTICAMLHCPLPPVAHQPGDVRPSPGESAGGAYS